MYNRDGDFGQVRLAERLTSPIARERLFCFDAAGWHHCNDKYVLQRSQGATTYLILITIGGEGKLYIGDSNYTLSPGSVAVLPPHVYHSYCTAPGHHWEFYWCHPAGIMADTMLKLISSGHCRFDCDTNYFADKFEQLLFRQYYEEQYSEVIISGLMHDILHRILILFLDVKEQQDTQQQPYLRQIIEYLQKHYREDVSLAQLSEQVYLSQTHIVRIMRQNTGYTPHQYLIRYRIMKAAQLLAYSRKSISEIADEVGFNQTSNFIKTYSRIKGHTPGEERKRHH